MRSTPLGALVLLCAAVAHAEQGPPVESPAGQVLLAVRNLATAVTPADAPYVRYLSFTTVPVERRAEFRRVFRFWFNHLNAGRSLVREVEVGKETGLVRIDTRDAPNWTRAAWVLVADRDYLFREPLIPSRETNYGRLVCGIQQGVRFAAGFILDAQQLFRDGIEADRTSTYYDLLYAAERHPDPGAVAFRAVDRGPEPVKPVARPWPGGVWPVDRQFYAAGSFEFVPKAELDEWQKRHDAWKAQPASVPGNPKTGQVVPLRAIGVQDAGKGDANFPAKGSDFEKRWDASVDAARVKQLLIDPRIGGIAGGADSDLKSGSFVAANDRAIRIVPTAFGWSARTFDVTKNTDDRDHIERFREIALGDAKADGGEILASLPNGAQAGLLVNAQDARVEVADTRLAAIRSDKIDSRYKDVRTHMGCIACHAPSEGFISFAEQVKDSIERGVKANVLDATEAQKVRDFYLSWERQIKAWRFPYGDFIAETTRKDGKSWTGAQTWEQLRAARDHYDRPVTIEVAAAELGMPVETLRRRLIGEKEGDGPIDARLNQLAVGKSIPRRPWQDDVAFKLAAFLAVKTDRWLIDPKILEAARHQVKP